MLFFTLPVFLPACYDVVSVQGHVDCETDDDGVEILQINAGVKMREEDTNATSVSVSPLRSGVARGGADLTLSIDRPSFDQWAAEVAPDDFLVTCDAPLTGVCYQFTAVGEDGIKVRDWIGDLNECDVPYSSSSSSSSSGGGGDDGSSGTLICNDGTTSASCTSCTTGCCSGHGGCS